MNFSIIDGCDDEAAGQDLRFSVRNKKETNRKKQALAGSIRRTAPPGLFFRIFCHAAVPKCPGIFYRPEHLPEKNKKDAV